MGDGETASGTTNCDVAVVGAGTVGLVLGSALAQAGFRTLLIGPKAAPRPGRTVALLEGSVRLLEELGAWSALEASAEPLKRMRIVDATGSLFRSPPLEFDADEIGRDRFGCNIPNDVLDQALADHADREIGLERVSAVATGFRYGRDRAEIAVDGHAAVSARLVVAADGRQSLARKSARIGVRARHWPQIALTGILVHDVPHHGVSTEFHTRQGPFTLVPLPASDTAPHRSSLVWVMTPEVAARRRADPAAFAGLVETQAQHLLGAMTLEGEIGAFPIATSVSARLTANRLVLTGEAAHALPPIGAQGLNLSFRDVAVLADVLKAAQQADHDLGGRETLDRYAALRASDVALRSFGVDMLNGSLLTSSPLGDVARGLGLVALGAVAPLRRAVMRRGLMPGA